MGGAGATTTSTTSSSTSNSTKYDHFFDPELMGTVLPTVDNVSATITPPAISPMPPPPPSSSSRGSSLSPIPPQLQSSSAATALIDSPSVVSKALPSRPAVLNTASSEVTLFAFEDENPTAPPPGLMSISENAEGSGFSEVVVPEAGMVGGLIPPVEPKVECLGESFSLVEVEGRMLKLKKFESKYPELALEFKSLHERLRHVEMAIRNETAFSGSINEKTDIELLQAFLKDNRVKAETSAEENHKLKRQVNELKEIQQLEAAAKSELFTTLQAKISAQAEEIRQLKGQQERSRASLEVPRSSSSLDVPRQSISYPPQPQTQSQQPNEPSNDANVPLPEPPSSPTLAPRSPESALQLKLRMRELTSSLAKMTEQRDKALERCKELESQAVPAEETATGKEKLEVASDAKVGSVADVVPAVQVQNVEGIEVSNDIAGSVATAATTSEATLPESQPTVESSQEEVKKDAAVDPTILAQLRTALDQKTSALITSQTKISQLQSSLDEKTSALTACESNITQLQQSLAGAEGVLTATRVTHQKREEERDLQMASLTRQIEDMTGRLRQQKLDNVSMERSKSDRELEARELRNRLQELTVEFAEASNERDSLRKLLDAAMQELDQARKKVEESLPWPDKITSLESRLTIAEEELETSRRLFETKSGEAQKLVQRRAELERSASDLEQQLATVRKDNEALKVEIAQVRRDAAEVARGRKEEESKVANVAVVASDEWSQSEALWRAEVEELKNLVTARESDLEAKTQELAEAAESGVKAVEEYKARESHLLRLNKTLKSEVKKLAKALGQSMNDASSTATTTQRSSSIDQPDFRISQDFGTLPASPSSSSSIFPSSWFGSQSQPSTTTRERARLSMSQLPPAYSPPVGGNGGNSGSSSSGTSVPPTDPSQETNIEYLKNVFLKFLESSSRDKKVQMLPAIGMILKLSPEELKRIQRLM
ncbi:hypothetical protein HDU76_012072 [Blyttiomyces sp. JEL0837]|nr:hypothetical protein HDU76_012072 [Blyttiomyces sp. JEL0837]